MSTCPGNVLHHASAPLWCAVQANEPGGDFPGVHLPPMLPEVPDRTQRPALPPPQEAQAAGARHAPSHSQWRQCLEQQQQEEREERGRGDDPATEPNTMAVQQRIMHSSSLESPPEACDMRTVYQDPVRHSTEFFSPEASAHGQRPSAAYHSGAFAQSAAPSSAANGAVQAGHERQDSLATAPSQGNVWLQASRRSTSRSAPSCSLDHDTVMRHASSSAHHQPKRALSTRMQTSNQPGASPGMQPPHAPTLQLRSAFGSASEPAVSLPAADGGAQHHAAPSNPHATGMPDQYVPGAPTRWYPAAPRQYSAAVDGAQQWQSSMHARPQLGAHTRSASQQYVPAPHSSGIAMHQLPQAPHAHGAQRTHAAGNMYNELSAASLLGGRGFDSRT